MGNICRFITTRLDIDPSNAYKGNCLIDEFAFVTKYKRSISVYSVRIPIRYCSTFPTASSVHYFS